MSKTLEKVGDVSHFFSKIGVAIIEVTAPLKVGDRIAIRGMTTNLEQTITSMEIEHASVKEAKPGDSVGLKVDGRVRQGDIVYKLS